MNHGEQLARVLKPIAASVLFFISACIRRDRVDLSQVVVGENSSGAHLILIVAVADESAVGECRC